jgi:nucleotidyltransferase-like protein
MTQKFGAIKRALEYSTSTLRSIRDALSVMQLGENVCVVATGSFGRQEASGESDVDFFLMHNSHVSKEDAESQRVTVAARIAGIVPTPPAPDGAFNAIEAIEEMLSNVGGTKDSNEKLTRRMLLLLEGAYLYNDPLFSDFRMRTLQRYISPKITNHQLARFLLNDVIRYYRTMCVDFEYKTGEQGKPWGIRNLKLMYSRKLLYFGGVVAVAETAQREYQEKLTQLLELLNLTPLKRLEELFGDQARECLGYYNAFLERLADEGFRRSLQGVNADRSTHTPEFRKLKNEAAHFSWALERLLKSRYSDGHPIHQALIL